MTRLEQETMESVISLNRKIPEITLRDLFAMSTLVGLSANEKLNSVELDDLAKLAYDQADAMLNERRKK